MRIGIDACTWANQRGYGRFTRALVTNMILDFPNNDYVLIADRFAAEEYCFPSGARVVSVKTSERPTEAASADGARKPIDLLRMGHATAQANCDVFLFPTSYSFYPLLSQTPAAVVFHDAIAECHPELVFRSWRSRLFWKIKGRLARWQADQVITVSEDARRQIADVFCIPADRIRVVSEGVDPVFHPVKDPHALSAVRARYCLPSGVPLVLYVGGISPHKNLDGLLRALNRLPNSIEWHAVLIGDYKNDSFLNCYNELLKLAVQLGLDGRITFTGFVPDEDLVLLYNVASVLVLPSVSEGFGLPVIEAMACGVPVAASDRGSIPEVLGDAGLLFDPDAPDSIGAAIVRVLNDTALRIRLSSEGLRRSEQFSWRRAAKSMLEILEDLCRHP